MMPGKYLEEKDRDTFNSLLILKQMAMVPQPGAKRFCIPRWIRRNGVHHELSDVQLSLDLLHLIFDSIAISNIIHGQKSGLQCF